MLASLTVLSIKTKSQPKTGVVEQDDFWVPNELRYLFKAMEVRVANIPQSTFLRGAPKESKRSLERSLAIFQGCIILSQWGQSIKAHNLAALQH